MAEPEPPKNLMMTLKAYLALKDSKDFSHSVKKLYSNAMKSGKK